MAQPVIATLGEVLVEFVAEQVGTGHRRPARYVGPFPSGAPAIFIDQAARMGARTLIAGAVGQDAFGDVVADRLGEAGVGLGLLRRVEGLPTGIAFVAYDEAGGRSFVYTIASSAAPRLPAPEEAAAAVRAAGVGVVHVSGASLGHPGMRAAILGTLDLLPDVALSFDPNLRPELTADPAALAAIRDLAGRAAYLLPPEADALALWPGEAFDAWAPRAVAGGGRLVAFKRGAAGASAWGAEGPAHVGGIAVEEVDPTGAGDCFGATFVTLIESGESLGLALAFANAAGAHAVTRLGPMEGNAGRAEVEAML